MENPVLQTIRSRRSVRSYQPGQVSPEELHAVLEAGQFAPNGGNHQLCHFIAIQNAQVLQKLKQLVQKEFAAMEIGETTYSSMRHSISQSKKGNYDFIFGAPTLILVANQPDYPNAMADSAAAIENMWLAAASLGLGACWINQIKWLTGSPVMQELLHSLGMSSEEAVFGGLCLGYPAKAPGRPLPRRGNRITFI